MTKFSLSKREDDWKKKIITPRVGVAGVVESFDRKSILIVKRKYPPYGYAFSGGMMEVGETVGETIKREVREETDVEAEVLSLFGVYSQPLTDPRWHVVVVFVLMRAKEDVEPKGMDDALEAFWIPYNSDKYELVISSKIVLEDYCKWRQKEFKLPEIR